MADTVQPAEAEPYAKIDTSVPHSARIWNYWLGGKDNFEVDRAAGDQVRQVFPGMILAARESRAFLSRAVRFLAGEAGVRQFLDVGTGLPTADNTHEVAQRTRPDSRIVYVDNDPMVLAHARALLVSTPEGLTTYIHADLHDPDEIIKQAREILDFTEPVAVMLLGVLGHVGEDAEANRIIQTLMAAAPSDSYLAISDGTDTSPEVVESHRQYNESGALPYHLRSPDRIARFFDGLELVEPGLVPFTHWRPDTAGTPATVDGYCGVGRKR
ncbi:SAM-dependent methyltransferase [Plantactinospora sp. GCM10030261]|uniref:SAM-dependent methyltransferase n=1 Tax=Plantactinospora sp. GCM10030261 TaxID=3273420 RepID=UPI00361D0F1A